jgi:hypothetical protein
MERTPSAIMSPIDGSHGTRRSILLDGLHLNSNVHMDVIVRNVGYMDPFVIGNSASMVRKVERDDFMRMYG